VAAIAQSRQATAIYFQEAECASVIREELDRFDYRLNSSLGMALASPTRRQGAIAVGKGEMFSSSLLTIDFNKLEWFQLGGLHVKHSCSPLNDVLGASTEAPFFVAASPLSEYGYLLKNAIATERFYQKPGIVEVWI